MTSQWLLGLGEHQSFVMMCILKLNLHWPNLNLVVNQQQLVVIILIIPNFNYCIISLDFVPGKQNHLKMKPVEEENHEFVVLL